VLPIFYINMASRPDRLQHIEQQLGALALSASRIEAVTPADFSPELQERRRTGLVKLNPGEIACSLSHQKIWQIMLDRHIPAALILEDDVLLAADLPIVLSDPHLLDHAPDAIQLETHATAALVGRPVPTAVPGVSQNRLMSSSLGTAAYVMTDRLARRVLRRNDLDQMSVDSLLFGRPGGLFYEARIFQAVPALAIQLDQTPQGKLSIGQSDLTNQRPPHRPAGPMPFQARLARTINHWRHHLRILTTFGPTGELWGARKLWLPVTDDLRRLM
jgi:GR25 family glycosyltransferase involved in LPS biosynthesis